MAREISYSAYYILSNLSNYYKETQTLYECNILASSILLYKQVLHVTLTIAIGVFVYQILASLLRARMCKKLHCISATEGDYILDAGATGRRVCERLPPARYSCRTDIPVGMP